MFSFNSNTLISLPLRPSISYASSLHVLDCLKKGKRYAALSGYSLKIGPLRYHLTIGVYWGGLSSLDKCILMLKCPRCLCNESCWEKDLCQRYFTSLPTFASTRTLNQSPTWSTISWLWEVWLSRSEAVWLWPKSLLLIELAQINWWSRIDFVVFPNK